MIYIKPTKFVQFCYYISNVLVLLSHDIVYDIKKESDQLKNNYNNKEQLKLISQNISNIITRSFNIIIDAFTFFQSGMFLIEMLSDDLYREIETYFEYNIQPPIIKFNEKFNELLNNIKKSEKNQNSLKTFNKIMNKIREYQASNTFNNKLLEEVKKDKKLNIKKQYNNIVKYFYQYNGIRYEYDKVDYTALIKNGKIDEKLISEITNKNIDVAKDIILEKLKNIDIEMSVDFFSRKLKNDYHNYCDVLNHVFSKIRSNFSYNYDYRFNNTQLFSGIHLTKVINEEDDNTLVNNNFFCYDNYYKKYAQILLDDISKIIKEVKI